MQLMALLVMGGTGYLLWQMYNEWAKREKIRRAREEWEKVKKQRLMQTWHGERRFW